MDVAIVYSRALSGINSPLVTIEVHLSRGLPSLSIVGLPETSINVRSRVMKGVKLQINRAGKINDYLTNSEIEQYCVIDKKQKHLLEDAISRFNLSARSLHRILKVTRTIADLEQSINIKTSHLIEAISYRRMDWLNQHLA